MIAVVAGASGGIGRSVVSKLLVREFIVFAWVKNKVGEVTLLEYLANANVRVNNLYIICADFCDVTQIYTGADEMAQILSSRAFKKNPKIDVFINCSGCFYSVHPKTGKDLNFQINFEAPILLIKELEKFASIDARAVFLMPNFNSNLRHFQLSNLSGAKRSYLTSKLLLLNALKNEIKKGEVFNIYFYCAKPTNTSFYIKNVTGAMEYLGVIRKAFSLPPEFSAEQVVLLATRPEYDGESGCLYYDLKPVPMPKVVYSKKFLAKANKFAHQF